MKRLLIFLTILTSIFIINCESEKMIPGETGAPVYLVPDIETSSDTLGCTFSWSFLERPLHSNVSVLSFQPSSNGYNIYFIPDVPGDYRVKCEVLAPDQKVKKETIFLCKIKLGATPPPSQSQESIDQMDSSEMIEAEPIYLEDEPTSIDDSEPARQPSPDPVKPKAEPSKSKPKPKPEAIKEDGIFTIQISSFKSFSNAEKEMKELKAMGLEDVYIKRVYIVSLGETWYRVRTNSFRDKASAREMLSVIKTKYKRSTAWIDKIE